MTDITRLRKNAEKKSVCVSSAYIVAADVTSTALQELFRLPSSAVIINQMMIADEASQAAVTVDFGFDGGAELGAALVASSTGVKAGTTTRLLTDTGKTVTAKFSAIPTVGKFHFIVEYIEYRLGSGELTNYGTGAA